MIARVSVWLRRLRRAFSLSEWSRVLLGLRGGEESDGSGLILVQIDTLGRSQLEEALAAGRMPYLRKLLRRERHRLHTLYPGQPSATPAVQAELFYGVKSLIPSFGYRDPATGKLTNPFHSGSSSALEERAETVGEAILRDGSAYADVFSGGAAHTAFCFSTMGVRHFLRELHPLRTLALLLLHAFVILRIAALVVVEFVLAFVDLARGLLRRRNFLEELRFIPNRVLGVVLLREIVVLGAQMDSARGLPVIHCNFMGYHEQSHRRGPDSAFAHWVLKGIDDAIRRLATSAARSRVRPYELWIYSDHGQEKTVPYVDRYGTEVHCEIQRIVRDSSLASVADGEESGTAEAGGRDRAILGGEGFFRKVVSRSNAHEADGVASVSAIGPVGQVYLPREPDPSERDALARRFVHEAGIPLVFAKDESGALAWTAEGQVHLPEQADGLLGSGREDREAVTEDLLAVIHHEAAGDFVISGWNPAGPCLSFAYENGAHGGPGREECRAFALLPSDAPVPSGRPFLRPKDLHDAVLRHRGGERPRTAPPRDTKLGRSTTRRLRVMTYNVHSCRGMDGRHDPDRVARVIALYEPDIVALQELDACRPRTDGIDQAHAIARILDMEHHFHPSFILEEERYGNAILSRFPAHLRLSGSLPRLGASEPRGALWVTVETNAGAVEVLCTHLGLNRLERRRQVRALLGEEWIGGHDGEEPIVLCGDMNAPPRGREIRMLAGRLRDAHTHASRRTHASRSWLGLRRIDYVFLSERIRVRRVRVPWTSLTRVTSDHAPVIVDLELPGGADEEGERA